MWHVFLELAVVLFDLAVARGRLLELEVELIQTQMAQKPVLRAAVYARALRASQNLKRAEVWVGAQYA